MADFMDIKLLGWQGFARRLGVLAEGLVLADIPKIVAGPVMDNLVVYEKRVTPVDTGELQNQTTWRETASEPLKWEGDVLSDAANVRTGYNYAQARAYGFTKVNGDFWTPPEIPPFPFQGLSDAGPTTGVIAAMALRDAVMKLDVIAH